MTNSPWPPAPSSIHRPQIIVMLALVLTVAAFLRLWRSDSAPPGLQVDEASNAWNAYCLLQTGHDEWGTRWPIFYTRAFNDYRSALYLYLLIPFQAVFGMTAWSTRLPAALGGIATVALIYYVGRHLFSVSTGLIAAGFLAVLPWHIQHTRWGHEATVGPFFFAAACAAVIWAATKPRLWRAALAGMIIGLGCYGYGAMRIVLPISCAFVAAVTWRHWAKLGRPWLIALVAGLLVFLLPLLYVHLTDPVINTRARWILAWTPDVPLLTQIGGIARQYAAHFGPAFLFTTGGLDVNYAPPAGYGVLNWYLLPPLLVGLAVAARSAWRGSLSSRVLLALVATYPVADVLFKSDGPNSLRCFNGVIPLALLAGFGATRAWQWMAARNRFRAAWATGAYCVFAVVSAVAFIDVYFGRFNEESPMLLARHYDLLRACEWLKPRIEKTDLVLTTSYGTVFPYIQTLVHFQYDPNQWRTVPKTHKEGQFPFRGISVCVGYGTFRFLHYPEDALSELRTMESTGQRRRVVMILRPHERAWAGDRQPVDIIQFSGQVWLLLYEFDLE